MEMRSAWLRHRKVYRLIKMLLLSPIRLKSRSAVGLNFPHGHDAKLPRSGKI